MKIFIISATMRFSGTQDSRFLVEARVAVQSAITLSKLSPYRHSYGEGACFLGNQYSHTIDPGGDTQSAHWSIQLKLVLLARLSVLDLW